MLAEELLVRVRSAAGRDVDYAEPPVRLGGGFYTQNHRFSLKDAPPGWTGPMVARLFPTHAPPGLDEWEAGVQAFAHERGLRAPKVVLYEPGSLIEGRRWFVMELLPGAPALGGIRARDLIGGLRRMLRDLPRQTADEHLALHRLDPAPLVESFGARATVARWWGQIAVARDDGSAHPLAAGLDWLMRHEPEPRAPLALCHGDTWAGNLLIEHGEVTGLIDWSVATVAEPALDVGFLVSALSLTPVPMPRPIQRVAQRVGRALAAKYRAAYESGSDADISSIPYYEALRCLLELNGVVRYRTAMRDEGVYDGPPPTWDAIADQMISYFEERTGVALVIPPPSR